MQTSGNNRPAWIPRDFVSLALTAAAVAVVITSQIGGIQAQITGTMSPTNPLATQAPPHIPILMPANVPQVPT